MNTSGVRLRCAYLYPRGPLVVGDGDDVQTKVAHLPDLGVLVVHQVDQVGGRLRLLDHVHPGALVAQHLLEDEHNLQNHLVVLLLRLQQLDQRQDHVRFAQQHSAGLVGRARAQEDDRLEHHVVLVFS